MPKFLIIVLLLLSTLSAKQLYSDNPNSKKRVLSLNVKKIAICKVKASWKSAGYKDCKLNIYKILNPNHAPNEVEGLSPILLKNVAISGSLVSKLKDGTNLIKLVCRSKISNKYYAKSKKVLCNKRVDLSIVNSGKNKK